MENRLSQINVKSDLARNVLIARRCSGYNHHKLVELSNLTRPVLSGIENGAINPTLETLIKLSKALDINFDLLFLSKQKFEKYKIIFRTEFEKSKVNHFDIYFPDSIWKELLKLSGNKERNNYRKIVKQCSALIILNFKELNDNLKNQMIFTASVGIIFQDDGFQSGLEFGAWLGYNLFR